jgi:hypothetical protein
MSLPDICGRKHGGSPTSVAANRSVHPRKPKQRESVLAFIALSGRRGCTCEEVSIALGMRYTSVSARISELKALGLVTDMEVDHQSRKRRRTTGGDWAAVVVATGVHLAIEPKQEATQKPSTRATLNLFLEATGLQATKGL